MYAIGWPLTPQSAPKAIEAGASDRPWWADFNLRRRGSEQRGRGGQDRGRGSAEIALVDVSLPQSSGVKVTKSILSIVPTIRVIGVTRHTDQASVAKMLGARAWGYVLAQTVE